MNQNLYQLKNKIEKKYIIFMLAAASVKGDAPHPYVHTIA